ncbi:hypothetical protein [Haemophilus sputorum]|uniref:hypothetical protein n=1 Tax=Haemophilus sputorum TaxID=1078480 RepID=UPI0028D6849A|nr:hypothetical protein [Haemophilus sputorum]
MELSELKNKIIEAYSGDKKALCEVLHEIEQEHAVYPFNKYEHLIVFLISQNKMTYEQYLDIKAGYISKNPNLHLFKYSPRKFGERFAQKYVQEKSNNLLTPSKDLDPEFSGEYDLWLDKIKIEVKASRAVDANSDEPLYIKALSSQTNKSFDMNFQQLKPQCCDVFIWVAVFRDEIILWIMNSDEVASHELFSDGQHLGNRGNEGQLHIKDDNIHLFEKYKLTGNDIEKAIRDAVARKKAKP